MAKKSGGPNKSQAIRDYYAAHPDAKPKEIAAELKKAGIDVSAAFISTIRSTSMGKSKKKKTGKSAGRPVGRPASGRSPGRPAASSKKSGNISIESLIKAKALVKELGGIDNVMTTLAALKRLAD